MEDRQKKIILQVGNVLLFLISITLFVIGLIPDLQVGYLSLIGLFLNPGTIMGAWIKVFINKKHQKELKEIVKDTPKPIEIIPEPIRDPNRPTY